MLVKLKIGKNLLRTGSDEIRFHSFIANLFPGLILKSSAKGALHLYLLTFRAGIYLLYLELMILPKNKETFICIEKFFKISTSRTTNPGCKNYSLKNSHKKPPASLLSVLLRLLLSEIDLQRVKKKIKKNAEFGCSFHFVFQECPEAPLGSAAHPTSAAFCLS